MGKQQHPAKYFCTGIVLAVLSFGSAGEGHGQEIEQIQSVRSFDIVAPGAMAGGLACDGNSLWVSAQSLNRDLLLQYSFDGKLLNQIPLPRAGNIGGGLAHDGKSLYVLDYRNQIATRDGIRMSGNGAIYRLEAKRLKKVIDLPAGQANTFGLTHMDGVLHYGHSPTVRPQGTIHILDKAFKPKKSQNVRFYVRGLASDGESIWCSSPMRKTSRIYRLDQQFDIYQIFEPSVPLGDLAYQDGSLWGIEHNKNRIHQFKIQETESK